MVLHQEVCIIIDTLEMYDIPGICWRRPRTKTIPILWTPLILIAKGPDCTLNQEIVRIGSESDRSNWDLWNWLF